MTSPVDRPPSRVIYNLVSKAPRTSQISLAHEKVPDAQAAAQFKEMWRERLGALTELLES